MSTSLAMVAIVVETGATVVVIVVVSAVAVVVSTGVLIIRWIRVMVVTVPWIVDVAVVRRVTGLGGDRWVRGVGLRIGWVR